MQALNLVTLPQLMALTSGRPDISIGFIDGPIAVQHPDLAGAHIRVLPGQLPGTCSDPRQGACVHGTFGAGILSARRTSAAPALCPGCTLLVRPIFGAAPPEGGALISTTPEELAAAIADCVTAGAKVLNMSVALAHPSASGHRALEQALDYAAQRGAIVVAAAGNQGTLGSSPITRHPWVIPVVACDQRGVPISQSNLGSSIGKHGLCAPGDAITSLGVDGRTLTSGGTSVSAPFVTGTVALLWSLFPRATATAVKLALAPSTARRTTVVPPLLDAWAAHHILAEAYS